MFLTVIGALTNLPMMMMMMMMMMPVFHNLVDWPQSAYVDTY